MASPGEHKPLKIVHMSDIHCGAQFVPDLLEKAIHEINLMNPDAVLVTGDFTLSGYLSEYREAKSFIDAIECENLVTIPGNHDCQNAGFLHFKDLFGERNQALYLPGVSLLAVDSTQPDIDEGRLGRHVYRWMVDHLDRPSDFKIIALHHHLLPVPVTGRERNVIADAGDFLELLVNQGVDIALSGHRHVPYVWHLEDIYIVTAGTVSSLRARGYAKPSYNVLDMDGSNCRITRHCSDGECKEILSFPIVDKPKGPRRKLSFPLD